jgi:hypothetical protein
VTITGYAIEAITPGLTINAAVDITIHFTHISKRRTDILELITQAVRAAGTITLPITRTDVLHTRWAPSIGTRRSTATIPTFTNRYWVRT